MKITPKRWIAYAIFAVFSLMFPPPVVFASSSAIPYDFDPNLSGPTQSVTVYYGSDAETYAKANHLNVPGKIVQIIHVVNSQSASVRGETSPYDVIPEWFGTGAPYLTNLQATQWDGTSVIGSTSINGPAPLSLSINRGVSASWSATGGVTAEVVSASVGFTVTASYNVTATGGPINVPAGHRWVMDAYPRYKGYNFEVWVNPPIGSAYQVGNGIAGKPIGADFVVWQMY